MSLFAELKRRNVFRVAIAYGVIAWVLAQIADLAFDNFGAPDWVSKSVLFVLILGLPLAVFFAWAFEMTPEGIKKEKDVDRAESITPETGKKLNRLIISVLVVAVGFLLWERTGNDELPPVEEVVMTDSSKLSIAVLPFDNRSNREEDEFFTEGIHDDLLTTMANIGSMKVISRTSVMEYKDTTKKIPEIAQELGVANILEGGIQRAGNQVRINVQLIDAETDEHLWAEIYDRELTAENLFAIQSEVSQAIAQALHTTLSPEEALRINAVPTENLRAYETYLLGRQRWETRTAASTAEAVELFLEAIELDPNFAEAWAGLGDAYRHQVPYGGLPGKEQFPKAEEAIRKALELNDDLAEAHAAMGGLLSQIGNFGESLQHLERAIDLNPSYSPAYNWIGVAANFNGEFDTAAEALRRGLEIDPLSAVMRNNLTNYSLFKGRFDEAEAGFARLTETHPESPFPYGGLADVKAWGRGRVDEALVWQLKAVLADPSDVSPRLDVAELYLELGDFASTARWIESARTLQPGSLDVDATEMMLELRKGNIEAAMAIAESMDPGPSRFPDPLRLQLLARNDIELGRAQDALDRYAEIFPDLAGADPKPMIIWRSYHAMDVIRLLRETGDHERAEQILAELITTLEGTHLLGLSGSHANLPAAYALAGRKDDALVALREAVDAGWRANWWYYLDYYWPFEALRDHPEFQSIRMEVAADLEKQRKNVRRMEANGELPVVPGMERISEPDKGGPPPI